MALVATLVAAVAAASGGAAKPGVRGDEALKRLVDGNKRYVQNKMTGASKAGPSTRSSLAKSQSPFAIVLACSDSRVAPELVFDQGLGDVFVVRVAGNVPDPLVLGSIEYAAEHLGSQLIVVMGHERCGAVKATVDSKGKADGNIGAIVKTIAPALEKGFGECGVCAEDSKCAETHKDDFVECVAEANVRGVVAAMTHDSKLLAHLVDEHKMTIVPAKYDLDDGKVTILPSRAMAH